MNDTHRTLSLNEAAKFLHMSPAVLRKKACAGFIKGAKPGKRWVFLECDLAVVDGVKPRLFAAAPK
jgi:hypothetical protein